MITLKLPLILIVIITIVVPTLTRKTYKTVYLSHFAQLSQQTVFLSKFDIGKGNGRILLKLKKVNNKNNDQFDQLSLNLALLQDTKYDHFKSLSTCEDRIPLYEQTIPINFYDNYNARHQFTIENLNEEHIYYVYLFDCQTQKQNKQLNGALQTIITMYNNGSHFGEDQNFYLGHCFVVFLWLLILIRFCCPVYNSLKRTQGVQKFIFYVSYILLGLSYLYYALNMVIIYYNGQDTAALLYLYTSLKNIAQAILVTTLVSIAWGWSLIHLKHDITYVIIGTVISLINITCLIIQNVAQDLQEAHHKYDRMTGTIILILRLIIFMIFVVGILKSRSQSVGKVKMFLEKFGFRGGFYLISWPLAVIFAECFLPNYLHKQVITFFEEITHLLATAMIGYLFAFPQSDYQKVDKRQDYPFVY